MGLSKIVAIILILLMIIASALTLWFFVDDTLKPDVEVFDPFKGKSATPEACKISNQSEAEITIRNIGMERISLPGMSDVPFALISNLPVNPNFEIDDNNDGVPDGWEIETVFADVVLVTDLSNSMKQCMDTDWDTSSCPDDGHGAPSNCKRDNPCTIDCSSWTNENEERYCSNTTHYFNTAYKKNTEAVGFWNFDEGTGNKAYDKSGNENNGTLQNFLFDSTDGWVDGRFGKALKFDGVNDYVNIGNPSALQLTGNLTISFWAYAINFSKPARQNPIDKAYGGEFAMTIEPSGTQSYYHGTAGAEAGPFMSCTWNNVWESNKWIHIALVRDVSAKTVKLYKNGTLIGGSCGSWMTPSISSQNITIGDGYVNVFNGTIDEVRIYNRTLTQSEIQNGIGSCQTTDDGVSCSAPYPSAINLISDCGRGQELRSSCNNIYPYANTTQLINSEGRNGTDATAACGAVSKIYAGNMTYGTPITKPAEINCGGCDAGECDIGETFADCQYFDRDVGCATAVACASKAPRIHASGATQPSPVYPKYKTLCDISGECTGAANYSECAYTDRSACGTPACTQTGPPYANLSTRNITNYFGTCSGGYCPANPPYEDTVLANCDWFNRNPCGTGTYGSRYLAYSDSGTQFVQPTCTIPPQCKDGNNYTNCIYINRIDYLQNNCGDELSDQGDRLESTIWRSCIGGDCCLASESSGTKNNVTACIEDNDLPCESTPGYFTCVDTPPSLCNPSYMKCCVQNYYNVSCSQYSDNCCEQDGEKCRQERDYACEKRKCSLTQDACCTNRDYRCTLTQDECCSERNERCQSRTYECADLETKCCKQKITCCDDNPTCQQKSVQEVPSCTPGYTNGLPSVTNDCDTGFCETKQECWSCENVAVRLAKKLDKNFTSNMIFKGNRVGLVSYGTTATYTSFSNDEGTLSSQINAYQPNLGQTCISCAINQSIELLKNSPSTRFMVLMSDGDANVYLNDAGIPVYDEQQAKDKAIELGCKAHDEYGITVYVIGFGTGAGMTVLNDIADCSDTEPYQGSTPEDLADIYGYIAAEIEGKMDTTVKVYGTASMKIVGEDQNYHAESKYVPVDASKNYLFAEYLKLNITRGDFLVEFRLYDNAYMNIANISLKNYSADTEGFEKSTHTLSLLPAQAKYGKISYRWWNATTTPNGTAWVDDIFFGPIVSCSGSGNSYQCGDINITKIGGSGDLYPFLSSEEILPWKDASIKDSNCISGPCNYMICSPDLCKPIYCDVA